MPSWSCPTEVAAAAAATAAAEAAVVRAAEAAVARAAEQKKQDDEAAIDEAANMAADELIPVMAYVLARAQIEDSLVRELRLLEAFAMAEDARTPLGTVLQPSKPRWHSSHPRKCCPWTAWTRLRNRSQRRGSRWSPRGQ